MNKTEIPVKAEQKTVCANNWLRSLYLEYYPYFGWEIYKIKGKNILQFQRSEEKSELDILQNEFDEVINFIKKCHTIQRLCSDVACLITVIIALIYFVFAEMKIWGWQSEHKIIIHTIMFMFAILPFVMYSLVRKSCILITKTAVDAKLLQIRDIYEKARKITPLKKETAIYILLTKPSTYISKAINLKTKDKYTHASMAFSEDLKTVYSFARKWTSIPLPAGFQLEDLEKSFKNKKDTVTCALYELKVSDKIHEQARQRVEQMIVEAPIYRFNLIGLFLCGFGIPVKRKTSYFCSQFISEILSFSKALDLPKDPSLMRPNDYTEIPELKCIYEGKLSDLANK